jgi:hypothetical protein
MFQKLNKELISARCEDNNDHDDTLWEKFLY